MSYCREEINQLPGMMTAWDTKGHVYRLENSSESRSLAYCAAPTCRAQVYLAREGKVIHGYVLGPHKCDHEQLSVEPELKLVEKSIQVGGDEPKKCLFRVTIDSAVKEPSFNVVKPFSGNLILCDALRESVCAATASLCMVEVSRWDADFKVFSRMTGDEIRNAFCEDGAKYKVTVHVGLRLTKASWNKWSVVIFDDDSSSDESTTQTTSYHTDSSIYSSDIDTESSLYPESTLSNTSLSLEEEETELSSAEHILTPEAVLEMEYFKNPVPDFLNTLRIAKEIDMPFIDVHFWFSNRHKKTMAEKRGNGGIPSPSSKC